MVNAQSIYFGSDEITSVYYGGNLVWQKPNEDNGRSYFVGVTSDGKTYKVTLNGSYSQTTVNSGEKYDISNLTLTTTKDMFNSCNNLTSLDGLNTFDMSNVTNINSMFSNCSNLTNINMSGWDLSKARDCNYLFYNCSNLTNINMSGWDLSHITNEPYNMFRYANRIKNIVGPITGIKFDLNFGDCELTHDSAMVLINGVAEVSSTKYIHFNYVTYNTLSKEEIALATSKGWSVVR